MPTVLKFGNLNLLETSGPVQACNGIALTLCFTVVLPPLLHTHISLSNYMCHSPYRAAHCYIRHIRRHDAKSGPTIMVEGGGIFQKAACASYLLSNTSICFVNSCIASSSIHVDRARKLGPEKCLKLLAPELFFF